MANRLFELPETKGTFQCVGIINGVEKDGFYTEKKTRTGKDWRAINFGCEYDNKKTIYMNLNGMPQKSVYFSKRNKDTNTTDTKEIPWANRNTFKEDGWGLIGTRLGLTKVEDKEGNLVNDKKTMTSFDACKYINMNLKDEVSTFIKGNIEFSGFVDKDGNARRGIKYVPNQISLCKDVNFEAYDYIDKKPMHNFTQTIVFMGIDKEQEDDKDTGRYIVQAKIVTYSDIIDTDFIIVNKELAKLFKNNLKPYTAITVHGEIEVTHNIETVDTDSLWGDSNPMNSVNGSSKTEMIITGADPKTIERSVYTEEKITAAKAKIRNAQTAEQNFSGNVNTNAGWGEDDFGDVVDFDEEW